MALAEGGGRVPERGYISSGVKRRIAVRMLVLTLVLIGPYVVTAGPALPNLKGDPQAVAEVQAAFQRFGAARSWRARMAAGGATHTTEYVAPDRYHLTISQGSETTEMYLIGREMWMKAAGQCQKLPATIPVPNPKEILEHTATETTITISRGGAEAVEGTPTQTYLLTVESRGTTTQEKLYVATGTGLPRRIEVQTPQGAVVVDYFDYNAPITINNPPC